MTGTDDVATPSLVARKWIALPDTRYEIFMCGKPAGDPLGTVAGAHR